MLLGQIVRGTKLRIGGENDDVASGGGYDAVFHYLESENLFLIKSMEMYGDFEKIGRESKLCIAFKTGSEDCIFYGIMMGKRGNSDMLLIERTSEIETISRRKYSRDELRFAIRIYGLPESRVFEPDNYGTSSKPDMVDTTFDISTGGLCVICNNVLKSEYDPFYLLDVSLSDKDSFSLPAKLVRRSSNPRSKIGRYEYSFQYMIEMSTELKSRLASAILKMKLM